MLLDSLLADDTRALVIDFDHGEIKVKTNDDDERKDEGKNRKKRQTVVCPYLLVLGLAHDPLGDTHLHGPLSGCGSSSGHWPLLDFIQSTLPFGACSCGLFDAFARPPPEISPARGRPSGQLRHNLWGDR